MTIRAMRRALVGGLFVLVLGAGTMAGAAGMDAPPAGTTLGYDSFTCTISGGGEDSVCLIDGGGRVSLFAQMFNHGKVPEAGHFGVLKGNSSLSIEAILLNEQARAVLRQLFPLSVGKSVTYRYEADMAVVRTGWQGQSTKLRVKIDATVTVTGEESVTIDGQPHRAFVVAEVTKPFNASDAPRNVIERTWWFAPDLGLAAKARFAWTKGWNKGASDQSSLQHVQWPAGAAPAVAATPEPTTQPANEALGAAEATTAETEAAAAPTPESLEPEFTGAERREIQAALKTLGYYNSTVDGDMGAGTRKAIGKFQKANKLATTGYLTEGQIALLRDLAMTRAAELAALQAQQQAAAQPEPSNEGETEAEMAKLAAERDALEKQKQALAEQQAAIEAQQAAATAKAEQEAAVKAEQAAANAAQQEAGTATAAVDVVANLEPIDEAYRAVKATKIRQSPNVTAPVLQTLAVGDRIIVLGKVPGQNWLLVSQNDQPFGYVVSHHLAPEAVATAEADASATTEQAADAPSVAALPDDVPEVVPAIPEIDFGRYHALIIGNDQYQFLSPLQSAVADATAISTVLRDEYGFEVNLLLNAGRDQIVAALDDLRSRLTWDDNLLIYYAGHGHLDDAVERGYWLPVDATTDSRARWLSNADITDSLKAMQAKHVMIVADSCYSGTLTRGNSIPDRSGDYLKRIAAKRARVIMTSGGNEPVSDGANRSPFAAALIDALQANEGVMDGMELFTRVRRPVVLSSPQTPEYSDLRFAGHDGGDFIFVRN